MNSEETGDGTGGGSGGTGEAPLSSSSTVTDEMETRIVERLLARLATPVAGGSVGAGGSSTSTVEGERC